MLVSIGYIALRYTILICEARPVSTYYRSIPVHPTGLYLMVTHRKGDLKYPS